MSGTFSGFATRVGDRTTPGEASFTVTEPLGGRVSVGILNWNGGGYVDRAIRSVLEQSYGDVEVILVDNGSTDGSDETLRSHAGEAKVCMLPTNIGYAAGMNAAFAASSGEYFIPMNADAILHPDFVQLAVKVIDADRTIGALGALTVSLAADDDESVWLERHHVAQTGPEFLLRRMSVATGAPARAQDCFKAAGAFPVLRRSVIERIQARHGVGPFDPIFDSYGEDIDLAFKIWEEGFRCRYDPVVVGAHEVSRSSARSIREKRGRLRRNLVRARYLNAARHLRGRRRLGVVAIALLSDVFLMTTQGIRGDRACARDVLAAWRWSAPRAWQAAVTYPSQQRVPEAVARRFFIARRPPADVPITVGQPVP